VTVDGSPNIIEEPSVQITLTNFDLNNLKYLQGLAASNRTFISITSNLVQDMNGNLIDPIALTNAMRVTNFTMDTTQPTVESFDLDMNRGILTLYFSETVMAGSLSVQEISILSGPNSSYFRTLTGGMVSTNDSTILTIDLDPIDLNDLKRQPQLAYFKHNYLYQLKYARCH